MHPDRAARGPVRAGGGRSGPHLRRIATRRPADQPWANQSLGFWDAPIRYGAPHYALAYGADLAARPLARERGATRAHLALHNRIIALIESRRGATPPGRAVSALVEQALRDGLGFQDHVAARLGLSVATLRRRLEEEGESFRAIRHRVLNARAKARLAEIRHVAQVAEELGFSDPRSFARAFAAWNGLSPAAWLRGQN